MEQLLHGSEAMNESYDYGVQSIAALNAQLLDVSFDYEKAISEAIRDCPSNLDAFDLVYSITIGVLSAVLDTNDKVADFFDEIHQLSSAEKVESDNLIKKVLAKILYHQGDWMDKAPTTEVNKSGKPLKSYITRKAQEVGGVWDSGGITPSGPHRIFWGHDIFSISDDNPFSLCIKEYGIGRGILQAIRHLVADTCSHQGLPLPFSSYFDYVPDASGEPTEKVRNHLLDFCQEYSKEVLGKKWPGANNEVFNHLFSIHVQDALSSGLVAAGIAVYCKGRKIDDKIRCVQMRVIGYMGTAYGSAIIGAFTHGGIPYINWPAFVALAKNIIQMVHISNKEVDVIIAETERLISERECLEQKERGVNQSLISGLYGTLISENSHDGRRQLIDYFGEAE